MRFLFYCAATGLLAACVSGNDAAAAVAVEAPMVTTPPISNAVLEFELRKRQSIDPVSLADVLLTALPLSLQLMAATNLPEVSKVLWSEFLDNNKPAWFTALPADVKSYLVRQYGPSTAWATSTPASSSQSTFSTSTQSASPSSTGSIAQAAATSSSTAAAAAHHSGLSPSTKIGLGVGIPLGILAILALLLCCCLMHRRRKQKKARSSRPPTPGFIPTTDRHGHSISGDRSDRHPLRGGAGSRQSADNSRFYRSSTERDRDSGLGSGIGGPSYEHDDVPKPPVMPYHSNNSRGSRSSFTSLHSVPEVPEHLHDHGYGGTPMPPPRSPRRRSLGGDPQLPPAVIAGTERERRRSSGRNSNPSPLNPAFGMSKAEEAHASPAYTPHQHTPNRMPFSSPVQHGQGIYAGQRNPFGNEYESSSDEFMDAPEYGDQLERERPQMRQIPYSNKSYGGHGGYAQVLPPHPSWQAEGERAELHTPANEWGHQEWPLSNEHAQHGYQGGRQTYDRVYDGT